MRRWEAKKVLYEDATDTVTHDLDSTVSRLLCKYYRK